MGKRYYFYGIDMCNIYYHEGYYLICENEYIFRLIHSLDKYIPQERFHKYRLCKFSKKSKETPDEYRRVEEIIHVWKPNKSRTENALEISA